jgi:predicted ABC-type ATPase
MESIKNSRFRVEVVNFYNTKLKKISFIAGPNGAGKTTFARDFLPAQAQTLRFINADLIAAGFAPFNPESAEDVAIKAIPVFWCQLTAKILN